jgi:hypothetical protein
MFIYDFNVSNTYYDYVNTIIINMSIIIVKRLVNKKKNKKTKKNRFS